MCTPSVHTPPHIYRGTHCKGRASTYFGYYLSPQHTCQTLTLPLLPHLHTCGSLCPKYHPGSVWLPIPPSLFKSHHSSDGSLHILPQGGLPGHPTSLFGHSHTYVLEAPSFSFCCVTHHVGNRCHCPRWRRGNGPGGKPKNFSSI